MAFVKRVLDAMFEGQNTKRCEAMCIKSLDAINQCAKTGDSQRRESTQVGNTNVGLTLKEAERVLTRVVEEGWFKKSGKGFLSLSPRALMELKGWLVETYNEEADDEGNVVERIKFCYACKEIVTVVSALCRAIKSSRVLADSKICRVNVALVVNALVEYTIFVSKASSVCGGLKAAQYARLNGLDMTLLVKRRSLPQKDISKASGEVVPMATKQAIRRRRADNGKSQKKRTAAMDRV